jgi:hypothetical protein
MSVEEHLVEDYLQRMSEEALDLSDMFSGAIENFATATIEGPLALARDSIDVDAVEVASSESGVNVLPAEPDVRRAARAVSKKWWCSFGYDYVLSVIRAKQAEVLAYFLLLFWFCFLNLVIALF